MSHGHFERLYAEHAGRLFSFLAYRTGDHSAAEDLLADVFERALRSRRPFDPRRGSEQAWLYAIAVNLLRDRARRNGAERRALDRAALDRPWEVAITTERIPEHAELREALDRLSDEEREAVALRFGADLSVPDIARVTGESQSTAAGRLYRALRKLRHEVDPEGSGREPDQ